MSRFWGQANVTQASTLGQQTPREDRVVAAPADREATGATDTPLRDPRGGPDGTPPRGPGGLRQEVQLVEKFDGDGDKRLDAAERKVARDFVVKERAAGRFGRGLGGGRRRFKLSRQNTPQNSPNPNSPNLDSGVQQAPPNGALIPKSQGLAPRPDRDAPGPRSGPRENLPPPEPGQRLTPADVKSYPAMPLYDAQTLRTFFFEFESADWEKELADFHDTDVEVPANLLVDGKTYQNVGVHFRGMSSFMMVTEGRKRSLAVAVDFAGDKQRLGGYRTLNLLNANGDPTFMRAVLFSQIAREYIPAPKANLVRVVINGESWGIYVNMQQFNKDFVEEWFGQKKGARWKAPGSPGGRSGLEYLGDDVAEYRKRFELKSKEDPRAWARLIEFCRVLHETPADQLEEKLSPLLDIDGTLKFLALENVFINEDGYWIRSSDYCLFEDEKGRFHIIPHDTNETFTLSGGPGFGPDRRPFSGDLPGASTPGGEGSSEGNAGPAGRPGREDVGGPDVVFEGDRGPSRGPRIEGVALDPLTGFDDPKKPLLSKLLAVPSLRARYLGYVHEMAEQWLDWHKLAPIVQQYQTLIAEDVKADTCKLKTTGAFEKGIAGEVEDSGGRGPGRSISLKSFVEQRRTFLLQHPELQKFAAAGAQISDAPGQK